MLTYSLFCGVNGAGKTTLYNYLKSDGCYFGENINPDNILNDFGGNWENYQDIIKSAALTRKKINYCLDNKISFSRETTILSSGTINELKTAISLGFNVHLYFIGVNDFNLALKRIENRVKNGGHGIPEVWVKQRFLNQYNHLNDAIKLSTKSFIYDNAFLFSVAAIYTEGKLTFLDKKVPWIQKLIDKQSQINEN